eukprot:2511621-Pleurochrysis_carterae.AAC.1
MPAMARRVNHVVLFHSELVVFAMRYLLTVFGVRNMLPANQLSIFCASFLLSTSSSNTFRPAPLTPYYGEGGTAGVRLGMSNCCDSPVTHIFDEQHLFLSSHMAETEPSLTGPDA